MSAVAEREERPAAHRELGLTDPEFSRICELLGREPNGVELAMFSLLWSEHCAYKHSRKLLRRLPTEGERVVMGPGENAGAVDIGDGYAIAFKVESHNHPSAVEPFQGAATGVGGILRDVFALGARPIAVLDSLRFGELDSERSRYLLDGAVRGIAHYGNSIGVPTVGGEIYFEAAYEQSCLVNAMCVGLARRSEMVRAAAAGVGNVVVIIGASTGRDGIGGASVLASAELDSEDDSKRPSVQIGDPFEESKLLECCLELLGEGLLVSLQDLGAAGLTSSAGEMASAGGVGIEIDVARVPLREADMEPFEVMVSESQERMLAVVEPGDVGAVLELCEKWQVGGAAIGEVTGQRPLPGAPRRRGGRRRPGQRPGRRLPALRPRAGRAGGLDLRQPRRRSAEGLDAAGLLLALLASPNIASKRWAFEQYDSIVGSRTVRRPGAADAAVLQVPEAGRAIAVAIDGNGRRVACDPYRGTVEAVLECAQNLACAGAEPLGLTNCLNFGNPEKPGPAWQLDRARSSGLADACEALGVPVVGGNVSLYNEGPGGPDLPDPGGRHGRRGAERRGGRRGRDRLRGAGRRDRPGRPLRALAGRLGAGEAARRARRRAARGWRSPRSRPAIAAVREAVRAGSVASAHDVSDGGLACALAESAIAGGIGCRVDLDPLVEARGGSGESALFGEGPGGFVLSGERSALEAIGGGGRSLRDRRGRRRGGHDRGRRADRLGGTRRGALGLGLAGGARRARSLGGPRRVPGGGRRVDDSERYGDVFVHSTATAVRRRLLGRC